MGETAVARKSKYGTPNEVLDIDAVAYGINDLPEAILEHILSFVPIEDAVRTCVLSKNWRYLWTSYPNLELVEGAFSGREQFTNFVDRVLVLQSSSRIKRLVLSCRDLGDASHVNLWVSTAVKRNVEDFTVHLSSIPGNFVLPHCLFSSATLTRLNVSILGQLKLPSRIWLPNLKVLHLEYITFVDKRSTEQLLSSPVLEELTLHYCTWDNLETLTIRTPMLKILTIHDEDSDCPYDCSSVHPDGCRVLIYGTNLESFVCISPFLNDYQIEKSCSLLQADIYVPVCCPSRTEQVASRLNKLLEGMCSVRTLTLSSKAVDVLSSATELHWHLPVFPKLKELNFGRLNLKDQVIVKLLHNSPNLETLYFHEGIELYPSDDEDGATLDPVPCCFGSHLRQIELSDVLLLEKEVCMLEPLLKHAVVLEKFMLRSVWDPSLWRTAEMFREKLLEIHCGSKSLETVIFWP
ncbi:hypothetical protein BT93_E2135 [Corymbia citriodora subsp. variegata]|nr:hypothetical protein BT93_E2135 [Corymbia citriodora subsp. variegata]